MIFIPVTPLDIQMWMKDTLIALDMLFFDDKGVIVHIHPMAKPYDLTPISAGQIVSGVIELNGGTCARLGISVGDKIIQF